MLIPSEKPDTAYAMKNYKNLGLAIVLISPVLAFSAFVFSENPCAASSPSSTNVLLHCLRITIYQDFSDPLNGEDYFVYTKYLLLACVALAAIGAFLLSRVPRLREEGLNAEEKSLKQ